MGINGLNNMMKDIIKDTNGEKHYKSFSKKNCSKKVKGSSIRKVRGKKYYRSCRRRGVGYIRLRERERATCNINQFFKKNLLQKQICLCKRITISRLGFLGQKNERNRLS